MATVPLSEETLAEWRGSPATARVLAALRAQLDRKREVAQSAYWAGNPWPEAERLALLHSEQWLDDMMTASAADFEAVMESDDERKRNSTD